MMRSGNIYICSMCNTLAHTVGNVRWTGSIACALYETPYRLSPVLPYHLHFTAEWGTSFGEWTVWRLIWLSSDDVHSIKPLCFQAPGLERLEDVTARFDIVQSKGTRPIPANRRNRHSASQVIFVMVASLYLVLLRRKVSCLLGVGEP